jgi:hypothetical protein
MRAASAPERFHSFFAEFVMFAVAGAVLGALVDLAGAHAYASLAGPRSREHVVPWAWAASGLVQVLASAATIWVLWRWVHRTFVECFQATLTGMAFVGTFFGAQWNIVYAMRSVMPRAPVVVVP